MSDLAFIAALNGITITANVVRTLLQFTAPTNTRTQLTDISVALTGLVTTQTPAIITLCRQGTGGTGTNLTLTKKNGTDNETLQTAAKHSFTVEPVQNDVLLFKAISPTNGRAVFSLPEGYVVAGYPIAIRVLSVVACTAAVNIVGEE